MPRYIPLLRPASFCTLPDGLRWEYVEAPANIARPDLPTSRHPHGVIETDRALTEAEIKHFDLRPI